MSRLRAPARRLVERVLMRNLHLGRLERGIPGAWGGVAHAARPLPTWAVARRPRPPAVEEGAEVWAARVRVIGEVGRRVGRRQGRRGDRRTRLGAGETKN